MTTLIIDYIRDASGNVGLSFASSNTTVLTANGWNFIRNQGHLYPTNRTKITYTPTGADQSFTVPTGVSTIFAKLWGAGGAGSNAISTAGSWNGGSLGGGGGHTYGLIPVTPGEVLTIVVGVGGQTNYTGAQTPRYGGGGGLYSTSSNIFCGSGGGYCGIFRGNITQANTIMIAGGGGGGGASRMKSGNWGGAGGGSTGQSGSSPYDAHANSAGGQGTQSGGGTAGYTVGQTIGAAGSALTGGYGCALAYGGGGGGGYYGGGGGGYVETYTMGGGGGGSGFINSTVRFGATFAGAANIPARHKDDDLPKTIDAYNAWCKYSWGGESANTAGGTYSSTGGGGGICVIYY